MFCKSAVLQIAKLYLSFARLQNDFSWSLTSHIIEDVCVQCVNDDNDDNNDDNDDVHDAHDTLLTTAIHPMDHGEYSTTMMMESPRARAKVVRTRARRLW
jgi:hypothetical protein